MENYEQILKDLGVEIPEDKKADLKKKMEENYSTKEDYDKAVEKRDEYKTSLEQVQEKLDGFKDVDVDDLKGQIQTLTSELADEKKARAEDACKVEVEKTVNAFLSSTDEKGERQYHFLNDITENHFRDALMAELDKDSAKGKSIGDIFKGMVTDADGKQKPGIFVDKAQANSARFTAPAGKSKPEGGHKYTMAEVMRMKNENPDLGIDSFMNA
ncbi:hypothetical protein DXB56_12380 [Clostridium sp. OM04-7]|uniref:phage scaffolding protein n=1 Tax=Clostridium sp. OM04-7 TaxID=2293042 RepID=UPI000E4D9C76|nr:hypothetical protein [Clostridium sp. OM04-7]RHV30898.1 hypothetical protein DXB56_12380 [Clostridium sp. OM04-7]